MDIERISAFIDLLATSPLVELEVEDAQGRIRLLKPGTAAGVPAAVPALPSRPPLAPAGADAEPEMATEGLVLSPMFGTFYRSPAPGEPPLVSEGQNVEAGQTLALIEAMKTLCKIPAQRAGVVRRILVANGDPVTEGEPLFEIE